MNRALLLQLLLLLLLLLLLRLLFLRDLLSPAILHLTIETAVLIGALRGLILPSPLPHLPRLVMQRDQQQQRQQQQHQQQEQQHQAFPSGET